MFLSVTGVKVNYLLPEYRVSDVKNYQVRPNGAKI